MSIALRGVQRDALYDLLLTQLGTFDDLRCAYERDADVETCYALGRMVTDALRLIMDGGLGWGSSSRGKVVELSLPEDELRSILGRIHENANRLHEGAQPEHEQKRSEWKRVIQARKACADALQQLAENHGAGRT
jgi:hypothetical protein